MRFEFEKETTLKSMFVTKDFENYFLYFTFQQELFHPRYTKVWQNIRGHLWFGENAPWLIRLYGGPKHMYSTDPVNANANLETDWCRINASMQTLKAAPCLKTQEVFLKDSLNLNSNSITPQWTYS